MLRRTFLRASAALLVASVTLPRLCNAADLPQIATVSEAMQQAVDKGDAAGIITVVAGPETMLHFGTTGFADLAERKPMPPDALFWIASMTKPVIGTAILMLQNEGKLSIEDPVAKFIPEMAKLTTADGQPAPITLRHLLTHTSGMREATNEQQLAAKTLAELIPSFLQPLEFAPGSKWKYSQTGINTLGRVIEIVSGQTLPDFLQQRLFAPLGMQDTGFYPTAAQQARLAKGYKREGDQLVVAPQRPVYDSARPNRFPAANGGLFSTAGDYLRFCQMLLNDGELGGKRYLSPASRTLFSTVLSGDVETGFTPGNAWGAACCIVQKPQGVTADLSPGSFGHGGAWGTQAWIDPVRKRIYLLFLQRADIGNSDGSEMRRAFQHTAATALEK